MLFRVYISASVIGISLLTTHAYSMGLRTFVALPVEKEGRVVRFTIEQAKDADTTTLITSAAYGISAKQTLLLGLPYRLSPAGDNRQGDVSVLYRHLVKQQDAQTGTRRLGLLGGAIIPINPSEKERDAAVQAGFVYTQYLGRNEIDVDALYQAGASDRNDSGRYDVSWQYRLSPTERPEWGIASELNSAVELNGRWKASNSTTHQVTLGLQWVQPKWVLEGGVAKDLNNAEELRYLLSTRFHF